MHTFGGNVAREVRTLAPARYARHSVIRGRLKFENTPNSLHLWWDSLDSNWIMRRTKNYSSSKTICCNDRFAVCGKVCWKCGRPQKKPTSHLTFLLRLRPFDRVFFPFNCTTSFDP